MVTVTYVLANGEIILVRNEALVPSVDEYIRVGLKTYKVLYTRRVGGLSRAAYVEVERA